MTRVSVGTAAWGEPLNAVLDEIEAKADEALAGLSAVSAPPDASTTVKGLVELATSAEVVSGASSTLAATPAGVAAAVAALVASAPGTLDTLNELAAALGDDPNFAATVTASLANKIESLDYSNAMPDSRFDVFYNGTAWPASRPTARTDVHFNLIGGSSAVADPAWAIAGDMRFVVM